MSRTLSLTCALSAHLLQLSLGNHCPFSRPRSHVRRTDQTKRKKERKRAHLELENCQHTPVTTIFTQELKEACKIAHCHLINDAAEG